MADTIKKRMINIMMYHTIANSQDNIKLSVMEGNKGLYMPSLQWIEDDKEIFYADNPSWIFGDFLDTLTGYINRNMKASDMENLKYLPYQDEDTIRDIIEILEKGIELGWNKVDI
jgi:hypothetical protein